MANNMIKFYRGSVGSLPTVGELGSLYITTDEGGIYYGTGEGMKRLGDFIQVASVSNLPQSGANASALYYCVSENILCRFDKGSNAWVQINKQKTLDELGGVSKSTYDSKISALEQADTDNATAISGVDDRLKAAEDKLKTVATTDGLSDLDARVTSAESDIDDLQAAIGAGGSVTTAIADAKKAGTDAAAAAAAAQDTADGKASMADVEAKNYATKTEAQGYADAKDAAIAAAKQAGDNAQADVDTLTTKVGTVPVNKTVVQMISDAQAAATYDDAQVKADITTNANEISAIKADYLKAADKTALQDGINAVDALVDTLIGTDTGKSARVIANEELAKQLIPENAADSLDTLTEIAAWIQAHPDDAAAMNEAITALQNKVGNIPDGVTATTIVAYIQEVVNAEKTRAEGAESGLDTRLDTIEAKFGSGEGTISAQINQAKSDAISTASDDATAKAASAKTDAIASAKTYTDTEIGKDRARLDSLETDTHTHSNKDELDKIKAGDKAKWDAMEQNAKTYADGLNNTMKQRVETLEAIDHDAYKAYADQAEEDAIATAGTNADAKVKALADGTVATNTASIAKNASDIATKANAADVYAKTETYTRAEVDAAIEDALAEANSWGNF